MQSSRKRSISHQRKSWLVEPEQVTDVIHDCGNGGGGDDDNAFINCGTKLESSFGKYFSIMKQSDVFGSQILL